MASLLTPFAPLASILKSGGPQDAKDASETTKSTLMMEIKQNLAICREGLQSRMMIHGAQGGQGSNVAGLLMSA